MDKFDLATLAVIIVGIVIKLGTIGFVLYLLWLLVTGLVA